MGIMGDMLGGLTGGRLGGGAGAGQLKQIQEAQRRQKRHQEEVAADFAAWLEEWWLPLLRARGADEVGIAELAQQCGQGQVLRPPEGGRP